MKSEGVRQRSEGYTKEVRRNSSIVSAMIISTLNFEGECVARFVIMNFGCFNWFSEDVFNYS